MRLTDILQRAAGVLWSAPMLACLFLLYLHISRKTGWPQRYIPFGMRGLLSGGSGVYGSLCVSLAAVLGVGNIVGMAMAVVLGGAGAVFWCWAAGLAGVGVQYAECLFSLKYRGSGRAVGPMAAMRAAGRKRSAVVYGAAVCLGGLAMGALIPANTVCTVLSVPGTAHAALLPAVTAALAAAVILGDAGRVFDFCSRIVPLLVLFYIAACLSVLFICRACLADALALIVREAFRPAGMISGVTGYGIGRAARWGTARGLFSSEAGMGTAGLSASAAPAGIPAEQAIGCACSSVWDTLIVAALTGVTFVAASLYGVRADEPLALAAESFSLVPAVGRMVLPFTTALLGFSTIIGWFAIARAAFCCLTDGRAERFFSGVWIAAVFAGGMVRADALWALADILCVFMLAPNLAVIVRLLPAASNDAYKLKLLSAAAKGRNRSRSLRRN